MEEEEEEEEAPRPPPKKKKKKSSEPPNARRTLCLRVLSPVLTAVKKRMGKQLEPFKARPPCPARSHPHALCCAAVL